MSNPVLNQDKFEKSLALVESLPYENYQPMSIEGTLRTTGIMGLVLLLSASYTWSRFMYGYTDIGSALTGFGAIVGFILALVISFLGLTRLSNNLKYFVLAYAACEGLFLGGISAVFETSYPGIVSTAVAGTFAALFSMLILYRMNIIRCTEKLRSIVLIATLSIVVIYIVDLIGHFFGHSVPIIYAASPMGLLFSAIIVLIAALNLILDFEFIAQGAERNFPKVYEWYGAFGLMVTVVWLYVEILRLLAKFQRR